MVKRTAFELFVSKRNFNRLQSHTHTACKILRLEGFRVRGELFEADWPVYPTWPIDEYGKVIPQEYTPGEIIDPESADWERALRDDDKEGFCVPTRRVYKIGETPEVLISDRAGWVAVDRIGFVSEGKRGPLFFPQASLKCYAPSDFEATRSAWRDRGQNRKRSLGTAPNGAMLHDFDTGEVAA